MPRLLGPLLVLLLIGSLLRAQDFSRVPASDQAEAARLFKIYRESREESARVDAVKNLLNLHPTVMLALVPVLERDWLLALTSYRAALTRQADEFARKKAADPAFQKEVATLRTKLAEMRSKKGGPDKDELKNNGLPALQRLRELFTIRMDDLVSALPALTSSRDAATTLTKCRVLLKARTILKDERDFTTEDLAREEGAIFAKAFRTDPRYEQVLAANAEITSKKLVPADEAEGIRDLNNMRMLLGLAPVLIDPKLHLAARDHSKDMAEKKFFAHDSPVPGKKSPWDRARRAGTSANAENIFMGNSSPEAANRSWFLSPGHHVNMFGNGRRGGMGRHEGYWTQMFGG